MVDIIVSIAAATVGDRDADVQEDGVSNSSNFRLTTGLTRRSYRPRVILVVKEGKLLGLVTVKDVLKHEAAVEHLHRQQQVSVAANSSSFQDWRDTVFNMEENAAGLEMVLEELLKLVKSIGERANSVAGRVLGRFGGGSRWSSRGDARPSGPNRFDYSETRGRESNEPRGEEFELGDDEDI